MVFLQSPHFSYSFVFRVYPNKQIIISHVYLHHLRVVIRLTAVINLRVGYRLAKKLMNTILLDLLAFGALISGILVITSKNPVISVLFLISVFVNAAGYLVLLGVGFIGIAYLIVYVGAIAVLFLFVVMMLNLRLVELVEVGREYTKNLPLGALVGALFCYEILAIVPPTALSYSSAGTFSLPLGFFNWLQTVSLGGPGLASTGGAEVEGVHMAFNPVASFQNFLQAESIGHGLYTYGSLWLILSSVILLLAMVGPIVLCLRSESTKV